MTSKKPDITLHIFNLIFIVCYFGVLDSTPLKVLSDLTKVILSLIGGMLFIQRYKHIDFAIKIYVFAFIFLGVVSIFSAKSVLKQSFSDGIIANFDLFASIGIFYYYRKASKNILIITSFEMIVKKVMWINIVVLLIFSIFDLSYNVIFPFTGNAFQLNAARVPRSLVEFGIFYYFYQYVKKGNIKLLMNCLLFVIAFHLHDIQRAVLLATLLTFLLVITNNTKSRSSYILSYIAIVLLTVALVWTLFSPSLDKYTSDFSEAFKIMNFDPGQITEASVRVRIYEIQYAVEQFLKRPFLGNGVPRASEKEALLHKQYFFIGDVGIIGIIFAYGIFGAIVYLVQCVSSLVYFKRKSVATGLYHICSAYIIYLAFKSFVTAELILKADDFLFIIAIMVVIKNYEKWANAQLQAQQITAV